MDRVAAGPAEAVAVEAAGGEADRGGRIEFAFMVRQEQNLPGWQRHGRGQRRIGCRLQLGPKARIEEALEQRRQVAGRAMAEQQPLGRDRTRGVTEQPEPRGLPGV